MPVAAGKARHAGVGRHPRLFCSACIKRWAAYSPLGLSSAVRAITTVKDGKGLGSGVGGWVYILASQPNGVLYVGVTADLARRVYDHREGLITGFTKRYAVKRLVWFERHDDIVAAIRREKVTKEWRRAYKVRLIVAGNPQWDDLYQAIL